MNATDVLTSYVRTGTMTNDHVTPGTTIGATSTRDTGDRLFGASPGSLAFQAWQLGAGLGWHGSIAAYGSTPSGARSVLLETSS